MCFSALKYFGRRDGYVKEQNEYSVAEILKEWFCLGYLLDSSPSDFFFANTTHKRYDKKIIVI